MDKNYKMILTNNEDLKTRNTYIQILNFIRVLNTHTSSEQGWPNVTTIGGTFNVKNLKNAIPF